MKRIVIAVCLSVSFFALVVCAQQPAEGPLTNQAIVKLVKAGFKEKTIIAIIHNRPSVFQLDPEQLIQLKRQGVNENIILAMLASQDATFVAGDDEWVSDEAFFKGMNRKQGGEQQNSGTNIFGSGGSSQSRSESRSGNGGNVNEGSVSGAATVRIIRPKAEDGSGGGAPKLEKTPTLDNAGVISLVEAGFSEGTIIKRIEESPVDFDLSPGKLDELYKKRVTDAIIAAMSAAMGKDR
ncbi:MAG TPA: hypothetical protein VFT26_14130 [Pyrinomonadaceae bacterium]|nr:hypothetical protein [Pyrinomonadaceae bacterium]